MTIFLNNQRLNFFNFFFNITLAKVWILNQVENQYSLCNACPQKVSTIKINKCAEHKAVFFFFICKHLPGRWGGTLCLKHLRLKKYNEKEYNYSFPGKMTTSNKKPHHLFLLNIENWKINVSRNWAYHEKKHKLKMYINLKIYLTISIIKDCKYKGGKKKNCEN